MTNQPEWECIAQVGNATPIEYGGQWILRDKTGVYTEEVELLQVDKSAKKYSCTIYRYCLDRLKIVDGYLIPFKYDSSWPHEPVQYTEWFTDDLDSVASFTGIAIDTLREWFCSDDACERARAYEAIGMYHGFDNLDSYPFVGRTKFEVVNRYSQNQYKVKS